MSSLVTISPRTGLPKKKIEPKIPRTNSLPRKQATQVDSVRPKLKLKAATMKVMERNRLATQVDSVRPKLKLSAATIKVMERNRLLKLQQKERQEDRPSVAHTDPLNQTWTAYECGCCYNEVQFEYLVQCNEGHLLCIQCLQRYVHEAVYGGGKGSLKCLAENCEERYPESQLVRALPDTLKAKLEERIQEEEISIAKLDNFVRCSLCNFGALLPNSAQYFNCPNPKCLKVTCRHCQVEFSEHKGLRCNEIEKESETTIRKEYEEKMAAAKIRQCPKCNTKFTKENGCNKITCRCGAVMCYLCRNSIKGYEHFCPHLRSPGKHCGKCNFCLLFTNCDQDDEIVIKDLKSLAQNARIDLGFLEHKVIGVPARSDSK